MSLPNDARLNIGTSIDALAHHVTNLAERSRRYGSKAKTKIVPGIVVEVVQKRNTSSQGQMRTFMVADSFFGGSYIKRSKLSLQSVKHVEPHAGHAALENLQRLNKEGARAPPGGVDNEGNLELVKGLPGETTPMNARIISAAAEDQDNEEGATESIIAWW